jgi:hypothetical protein
MVLTLHCERILSRIYHSKRLPRLRIDAVTYDTFPPDVNKEGVCIASPPATPTHILGHFSIGLTYLVSECEKSHDHITSEIIRRPGLNFVFELDWCSLIRQALNSVSPRNNIHEWNSRNFPYSSPEFTIARCDNIALVGCHPLH